MEPEPTELRPHRARWLIITGAVTMVGLLAAVMALTRPLPPRTVVMATGPEEGIYSTIGERYRSLFARHGVRLVLRATNGSVDNVALLNDPHSGVSAALVQSGITTATEAPDLVSLGTLFYEPIWLFSRVTQPGQAGQLRKGMRMSLGAPGSGTYKVARELAAAVGIDLNAEEIHDLSANQAGGALLRGDLDFVAMALSWDAPVVHELLLDDSITPLSWPRADAHVALRPYLSKLTLPRGVASLARDRPPTDLTLIATKASLIVRSDLHPALQYLFLEAASDIHGGPGIFNKAGEFPAAEPVDLPLSEFAREYYRTGRPFLQRYLPFWLAALTARLLVLLIPLIGIAYPLFRLLPAMYGWAMRRRIFRLYGELKFLEAELDAPAAADTVSQIAARLDQLEARATQMRVPTTFAHMLYTLKIHIGLVRQRVHTENREHPPS